MTRQDEKKTELKDEKQIVYANVEQWLFYQQQ